MNVWDDLVKHIQAGDTGGTVAFVTGLGARERRVVAGELPGYLAARARQTGGWWEWHDELSPLLMAGTACLSGAAAVAGWLFRREFRWRTVHRRETEYVLDLLRARPEAWQADVARRMAGRLRLPDLRHWPVVAALVRDLGLEPPGDDVFMAGWLLTIHEHNVDEVAADPLFPHLAPRIFTTGALRQTLTFFRVGALGLLTDRGALDRAAVIDGALGRLLGDGPSALPELVRLHERLDPDLDETAARAVDYVRLLPAAPLVAAEAALERLRRLEAAGRLSPGLFGEAVEALAFRPEKKLLRATVSWIGEAVARAPEHTDTGLCALAALLTQDALAVQERAVRLAARLAGQAGETGREAIRDAAAGLPAELREKISAAYGRVAAEAPPEPPALVAAAVPAPPPPIASPGELAGEIASVRWDIRPERFERILAGLVEQAHREPDALRAELRSWWHPFEPAAFGYREYADGYDRSHMLLCRTALAFASPQDSRTLSALIAGSPRRSGREEPPAPGRVYRRRAHELIACFEAGETYPVLLATPTSGTGHVDPEALLERLRRLEEAGARALPADLCQALLRLPRSTGPEVARAAETISEAGRRVAAWLDGGGLPDPVVTCEVVTYRTRWATHWACVPQAAMSPPLPGLPEPVADLCTRDPARETGLSHDLAWWPAVMPSHREVVAAHLLQELPVFMEENGADQAGALIRLAHGDGPVGTATAHALVCGMGHRDPAERACAVEALLTLAARDQAPAAELAEAVTELVRTGVVKLNRVTEALGDAARAGAHAAVWTVIAGALPGLLPGPGERPRAGLADLLAAGAGAG
ncbi:DUF6493 family protein, partial [Planomonospora corallina]